MHNKYFTTNDGIDKLITNIPYIGFISFKHRSKLLPSTLCYVFKGDVRKNSNLTNYYFTNTETQDTIK